MWRDGEVAAAIAAEVGQRLMELRSAQPSGTASLGARGDAAAHSVLLARLRQLRGDDPVVSEEGDVANAPIARRFWLVDPLDGTREYAERDRSDWAIHVAVVIDGVVTAGAVALPACGLVLSTVDPPTVPPILPPPVRILVSRSRPPAVADALASAVGGTLVPLGSAGAKTAAVILGEA